MALTQHVNLQVPKNVKSEIIGALAGKHIFLKIYLIVLLRNPN